MEMLAVKADTEHFNTLLPYLPLEMQQTMCNVYTYSFTSECPMEMLAVKADTEHLIIKIE